MEKEDRNSGGRYGNDKERDDYLRKQLHNDDPMLGYIQQEEEEERRKKRSDNGKSEKVPVYKGIYPDNRYNIKPGYRWDGVDRSNGHEKRLLTSQSSKVADEEEAYRWRTEDL